jgi:hypothetical protein
MTGNAINAKSDALVRDLSSEELDAVSGGFIQLPLLAYKVLASKGDETGGTGGGQNDPCFNRLCSNSLRVKSKKR